MTKAIRSYPRHEQARVVSRRLSKDTKGCGYWAAVDYQKWLDKVTKEVKKPSKEQ